MSSTASRWCLSRSSCAAMCSSKVISSGSFCAEMNRGEKLFIWFRRKASIEGCTTRRQNSVRTPGVIARPVVLREPRLFALISPLPRGLASHRSCQVWPGWVDRY